MSAPLDGDLTAALIVSKARAVSWDVAEMGAESLTLPGQSTRMRLSQRHLSAFGGVALGLLLIAASSRSLNGSVASTARPDEIVAFQKLLGEYAERYFARAQRVVSLERVTLQPLDYSLQPQGRARHLEYELRVERGPRTVDNDGAPTVLRQLLTVDGRPARPRDEPGCMDPRAVSSEPLEMLLPANQNQYAFSLGNAGRVDGRSARALNYRSMSSEPPTITWKDDCVSVEAPGRTVGRIWADAVTGDVLRFEEHLNGLIDVPIPPSKQRASLVTRMTIERADTTIRYKPVSFHDPDEEVLLPVSVDTVTVIRDAGVPRLRTTQSFSNYRRFVTGSKVLE
jgi:hypothetical protein